MRRKKDDGTEDEISEEVSGGENTIIEGAIPSDNGIALPKTMVQVPSHNCFMTEEEFVALTSEK